MKNFWQKIKHGAKAVGDFQARLLLTVFYVVLVIPTGWFARLGGVLDGPHKPGEMPSYWQHRDTRDHLHLAKRQG